MPVTPGTSTTKNHAVRSSGFTLVELLAVMLILAILMTLVIGASKIIFTYVYVDETKNNMKIIMAAITMYRETQVDDLTNANLVDKLKAAPECKDLIGNLGKNVWSTANPNTFRDAWGNAIRYEPSGGLAGTPGLTSPGPDGDINTTEDNVRFNTTRKDQQ